MTVRRPTRPPDRRAPLIDAMLGLYMPALAAWVAPCPMIISVLEVACLSTVPLVLATVVLPGFVHGCA